MCDRIVVFDGNLRLVGQTIPVAIYDTNCIRSFGAVVTQHRYFGRLYAVIVTVTCCQLLD